MKKSVLVGIWDANNPDDITTWLYHGITREKALIAFIQQYINKDYSTASYPGTLPGIYNSKVIKDRILYDINDDLVIYAQFA